jgi:lipopolysaccharide transport system ATP-binding protein
MDQDTVIKVEHVSKKFCKSLKRSMIHGVFDIARNAVGLSAHSERLRKDEFWALDDVSFELKKGEVLGIIGSNGSGKTTMLKLLNGIFWPDKGKIEIRGRVGALIAVGAGFHPNLTGRENIYMNGAILGMSKKEIDDRLEEIIEFADIGDFIDSPVKYYSSGMSVRLGFSSAIFIEPEVLLIDEVLSVGDLSFQNKSLRKLAELRKKSNAVIFISHNLIQVKSLCSKVIVFNKGKIVYLGDTVTAIDYYKKIVEHQRLSEINKNIINKDLDVQSASGEEVEILDIKILNKENQEVEEISIDETLFVDCYFRLKKAIKKLEFSVGILNEEMRACIWVKNTSQELNLESLQPGNYKFRVIYPEHHLAPNVYIPNIAIRNADTMEMYEKVLKKNAFRVVAENYRTYGGIVAVKEKWQLIKQ